MAITRTPQDFAGPAFEEEIIFYDQYGALPIQNGTLVYSDGYFYLRDGYEIYVPQSPGKHKRLRQLIHFIDDGPSSGFASGAYREILPAGDPFPSQVIWWASSSKLKKIVETVITRNSNKQPSSIQWKMYDVDGSTVLETVTDSVQYLHNIYETNRTRTIA